MRFAVIFFLSFLALLPSGQVFAKSWTHPDKIFAIQYPDWLAPTAPMEGVSGPSLVIADAKEESLARCSFVANAYHNSETDDPNKWVAQVLQRPSDLLAVQQKLNPTAKYVTQGADKTITGMPMALFVFDYTLFYQGHGFPMRAIQGNAFNTDKKYVITMQCTDQLARFAKDGFTDIFETLVIIPRGL